MNELHLFAGVGGGILGGMLLGHTCVCAVEVDAYCRSVLLQRQRDGILPRFPILDDIRTFDGRPWRGRVNCVCGGFPCQDISCAGNGAGIDGERSGLWREFARVVREVVPEFVFVENSPMLTSRGLGRVLGDLAEMGYNARWGVLGAADSIWDFGNPCIDHERFRIWIVASLPNAKSFPETRLPVRKAAEKSGLSLGGANGNADSDRWSAERSHDGEYDGQIIAADGQIDGLEVCNSHRSGCEVQRHSKPVESQQPGIKRPSWWAIEPAVGRMAYGVAYRVDRLRAIGNGQVPAVAALAWRVLTS